MVTFADPQSSVQHGRHLGLMRNGVPAFSPMESKVLAAPNLALGNDRSGIWIIGRSPTAMLLADPARPLRPKDGEGVRHG